MSKVIVEPNVYTDKSQNLSDTLIIKKVINATTSLVDTRGINDWGYEDIVSGLYAVNVYCYQDEGSSNSESDTIALISIIDPGQSTSVYADLVYRTNNTISISPKGVKITYDSNNIRFNVALVSPPQPPPSFFTSTEVSLLVRYNPN